jgi:putative ABC transport system ATP-binding protein
MEAPPIVDARGVTRTYQIGDTLVPALKSVDLAAHSGEFISIKGRSGSGKTTLLNLIGGLDKPDEGVVFINGRDISQLSEAEMVELRRREISYIFQSFGLLPNYSAYETVEFTLRMAGYGRTERHERALECLTLVGLDERLHHRPDEMSGGQQQRLCIARAIASHPSLILADEPTGELDSHTGQEILSLLRQLAALEDTAIIVATHDPIILKYATSNYELSDGSLGLISK